MRFPFLLLLASAVVPPSAANDWSPERELQELRFRAEERRENHEAATQRRQLSVYEAVRVLEDEAEAIRVIDAYLAEGNTLESLESVKDPYDSRPRRFMPLLHAAVRAGRPKVIEHLLVRGASSEGALLQVPAADPAKQLEIARLLLARKASTRGALTDAIVYHRRELLELYLAEPRVDLNERGADKTPLTAAIGNRDVPLVKRLLAKGAKASVTPRRGSGPMLSAAYGMPSRELFELLLAHGGDKDEHAWDGPRWTVLFILRRAEAEQRGNPEDVRGAIAYLESLGASAGG